MKVAHKANNKLSFSYSYCELLNRQAELREVIQSINYIRQNSSEPNISPKDGQAIIKSIKKLNYK